MEVVALRKPLSRVIAAQRYLIGDAVEERDLRFDDTVFRPSLDGENVAVRSAFSTNDFLGDDRLLFDEHLAFGAPWSYRIKTRRESKEGDSAKSGPLISAI